MTSKGHEKEVQKGRGSRLVVTLGVALAIAAGGGLGVYHLTDQGDGDAPKSAVTVEKEEVAEEPAPTEGPADEVTVEEPAPAVEEPTATTEPGSEPEPEPQPEVERVALADLDESVTVLDGTVFELNADGWVPVEVEGNGLVEAFEGVFVGGDTELQVTATYWETNGAAEKYVNDTADELSGEEIASGSAYTNGNGIMKAFVLDDPTTTAFAWTTDRGHALRVVGEAAYTPGFFNEYEL